MSKKPWPCRFGIHDMQTHKDAGEAGYVTHRACLRCKRIEIEVPLYNPPAWTSKWMEIGKGQAFIAARDAENARYVAEREERRSKAAAIVRAAAP